MVRIHNPDFKIESFGELREASYYANREVRNRIHGKNSDYLEHRHNHKIRLIYDSPAHLWNRLVKVEITSIFDALERRGYDIDALIKRLEAEG